ncbi:2-oxoadipate dioxygenase/decarboxylase family protein [Planotetraspora sp. GP83]|uniref:2-oxoadipate dioxygenase/decarboxylase n=1 Tax=Planotetraspora sp. GP83 TaxID=3156264 RepID=UPI00351691F1
MTHLETWQLRAEFARRLSDLYGTEVPAYTTLVDVSQKVNAKVLSERGASAERLGSISRVTAERHGAIRVGTPAELAQVARIFGALGMSPTGFYDLRDAAPRPIPVISTAFRPITAPELAKNPFRVFVSLLVPEDRRFFDADLTTRLTAFLSRRRLFPGELLTLADSAEADGGLDTGRAARFLDLAVGAFALSDEPVDRGWYQELEAVSSVAADIGGVTTTHINHLTPRVLDIDELYRQMSHRGVEMIDEIQGPPRWDGPDVLLRQTSFRALAEPRRFRDADGTVRSGELRVRFGEVEARGIALTTAGRNLYDALVAEADRRLPGATSTRQDVARQVWSDRMPRTERELAAGDLAFFTYEIDGARPLDGTAPPADLSRLVADGWVVPRPIVYEDFLPRSAAGIFSSNLTSAGAVADADGGVHRDAEWMSAAIGRQVQEPGELYEAQRAGSLRQVAAGLGLDGTVPIPVA